MKTRRQLPHLYYPDRMHSRRIINPYAFGGSAPPAGVIVAASATTGIGTATTSHTLNLPTGIASGDCLIMIVRTGSSSVAHTGISGWTEHLTYSNNGRTTIYKRTADGSEGSTATLVSSSPARKSAAIALRITGHLDATVYGTGVSTSYDPPTLSPSFGSADYLWLAIASSRASYAATAAPTDFTGLIQANSIAPDNTDNTEATVLCAARQFTGSSLNPDAFTVTGANTEVSFTLAIR